MWSRISRFEHFNYKRFQNRHANGAGDKHIPPHEGNGEEKITEKYAILCDLFLKLNFRIVNNAHFKLSWLGCLSAIGSLHRSITESQHSLITFTHLL